MEPDTYQTAWDANFREAKKPVTQVTNPALIAIQAEMDARDSTIADLLQVAANQREEIKGVISQREEFRGRYNSLKSLFDAIVPDTYQARMSIDSVYDTPHQFQARPRTILDLSFEVKDSGVAVKWLDAIKGASK